MTQIDVENILREFGLNSTLFIAFAIFMYNIY